MAGLLDSLLAAARDKLNFDVEGLSLPNYKQQGCEQAAFPYLEAILVFSFLMFVWGTWHRSRWVDLVVGRWLVGVSPGAFECATCTCQIRGRSIEVAEIGARCYSIHV